MDKQIIPQEKKMVIMNFQTRIIEDPSAYVVITPCFNEEKLVEYALFSMTKQTILPEKWVIVDDGSTDDTAKIIKEYCNRYNWIEYFYNEKLPNETYYSSNVFAILKGISKISDLQYSYLSILDADIELCPDYYERIFEKFEQNPELGIATGTYLERENNFWEEAKIDRRSTPKAIQVFKRECYEMCGGYLPFRYGGEDSGIEVLARMNGWQTWSFNEIKVKHHRPVGTGEGRSLVEARFRIGITDYCLGTHPVFMLFKTLKRMFWEKPYLISGLCRLLGYFSAYLKGLSRQLPGHVIDYLRKEQLNRIFNPRRYTWKPR